MNHPGDLDDFIEGLPRTSDVENAETVLTYLNDVLRGMSTETLRMFRAQCVAMRQDEVNHATVLEVVDGLLALREMAES